LPPSSSVTGMIFSEGYCRRCQVNFEMSVFVCD
jgi:hypothetical protein